MESLNISTSYSKINYKISLAEDLIVLRPTKSTLESTRS